MAVIRLYTDEVFQTDSQEYEILYNGVTKIKEVPGALVEIGTRRGGSAKIIVDALEHNNDVKRNMFCIDPYGNIEYECTNLNITAFHGSEKHLLSGDPVSKEITTTVRCDYTNEMRNMTIPSLYYYAYKAGLNFQFFCLEDSEFFNRYSDGVPCYNEFKELVNNYAFVFFDGPHTNEIVKKEISFFNERSSIGTVYVFDDIWMYNHDEVIEPFLFSNGFELLEKGKIKASYIRKK